VIACPPPSDLERFQDQTLPAERMAQVEAHLGVCQRCQEAVERLLREPAGAEPHAGARELRLREDLLARLADPGASRSDHAPAPAEAPAGLPRIPGFEILGALGHGGMGAVYKARQVRLNRLVALKMILAGEHADGETRRRFKAEAEAVARLQHPNIVEIYEVGEHGGRPFLVLELCAGGTLAKRLNGTPLQPHQAAETARALALAVDAAHRQGVVHRDLKPSNVLLTAEGILKIADFGLAKRLDDTAQRTVSGAVVGTPSYMAPEQAGKAGQVGPAADVYALGAILYELLTGRPPFRAADPLDTLLQVLRDEPVPPRRLAPQVPRDLETIALKCLAKEPRKRYPSAGELADDLERYLRGEPIQARRTPLWERALKWARRRPAAAALVAGAALLAALGVAAGIWYSENLRRQNEDLRAARAETARQRDQALAHLKVARQAVQDYCVRVSANHRLRRHDLEKLRMELLRPAVGFLEAFVRQHGDDPDLQFERAQAYGMLGRITSEISSRPEAVRHFEAARDAFQALARAYPNDAKYRRSLAGAWGDLGQSHQAAHRFDRARDAYGRALELLSGLVKAYPADATYREALGGHHSNLAGLHLKAGRPDAAESHYRQALQSLTEAVRLAPKVPERAQALAAAHNNLGIFFHKWSRGPQRLARAEKSFLKALAVRERLVKDYPLDDSCKHHLAGSHNNLGGFYLEVGRPDTAAEHYTAAVKLDRYLARQHPTVLAYRQDLGQALANLATLFAETPGKAEQAQKVFDEALAVQKRLADEHPSVAAYQYELAQLQCNLGNWYLRPGPLDRAERACRTALASALDLTRRFPKVPAYRKLLGDAHEKLGNVLTVGRRAAEAEREHLAALKVRAALAKQLPGAPDHRNDLAASNNNLAALYAERQPARAERHYREALGLREGLVRDYPQVVWYRKRLAELHNRLGGLLHRRGRVEEAAAEAREAVRIQEGLVRDHPAVPAHAWACGRSCLGLADRVAAGKDPRPALGLYGRAVALLTPLYERDPGDADLKDDLRRAHARRAGLLSAVGQHKQALADWEKAVLLAEGRKRLACLLDQAISLASTGDLGRATAAAEEVARSITRPQDGKFLHGAASIYSLCSREVRKQSAEDTKRRIAYEERAMHFLHRAHATGYYSRPEGAEWFLEDRNLAPLSERQDYQQLVKQVRSGLKDGK
jgi:eukaryotic-like serine/threonine-protein kinase